MGARIKLTVAGVSQIREIAGGGSYLSQSDLRANFGLGRAGRAETIEVQWPSGEHQLFRDVPADQFLSWKKAGRNWVSNSGRTLRVINIKLRNRGARKINNLEFASCVSAE